MDRGYGAEDLTWVEPEDDSLMQEAIFRALTKDWPRCYICSAAVAPNRGWHRDGQAWCPDHQPIWSRP